MPQTKGSIGYIEYAYAKQNNLTHAKMTNRDGAVVEPTAMIFQAAAAHADWALTPGYGVILSDQPGADSWPMTAATFILIHKQPRDPAAAARPSVLRLGLRQGRRNGRGSGLCSDANLVVASVKKTWTEIKDANGQPLHAASH